MYVAWTNVIRARGDERGFTLPEVLTTIAILGILLAIAMAIWNSVIEARRVDAAANQVASDMRLAHTRATNQLIEWQVILAPERADESEGPDYYLAKMQSPALVVPRTFPANVKIRNHKSSLLDDTAVDLAAVPLPEPPSNTRTMEFNPNGTMAFEEGPSGSVCVTVDEEPEIRTTALSTTSRVEIKDEDCEAVDVDP